MPALLALQPCSQAACLRSQCCSAWRAPASFRWQQRRLAPGRRHCRPLLAAAADGQPDDAPNSQPPSSSDSLEQLAELADLNRLQTALNTAIAAEDWQLAAGIRDLLRSLTGADGKLAADWQGLGIRDWLADRAESLGFTFPAGEHETRGDNEGQQGRSLGSKQSCVIHEADTHHTTEKPVMSLLVLDSPVHPPDPNRACLPACLQRCRSGRPP